MPLDIQPIQRDGWSPLPFEGCRHVQVKMLMKLDHLGLAMLRFEPDGTIHEHPADIAIDVICLEGEGMVSMGGSKRHFGQVSESAGSRASRTACGRRIQP